jgi:hypothetical protein
MSLWVPITIADLNNAKIASLVTTLRTVKLDPGQSERSAEIIQRVVNRVRRKIASCKTNRLDADPATIPQGLKDDVITLVLIDLKGALEEDLTTAEAKETDRINADLNRIANCQDVVEQPDNPIDAPVEFSGGHPTISTGRREEQQRRHGL